MTGNPFFGKKDISAFKEACTVINTPQHEKRMNELHFSNYKPPKQRTRRLHR